MKRMGSVSNAPWFDIKKGAKLFGELEGMFERPDERNKQTGKSKFFQIKAKEPVGVYYGRGKDRKPGVAPAGTTVNVNYGPKTKDLEPLIPMLIRGAAFDVEVVCTGDKMDIGRGQTMWPIEVGSVMTKAETVNDDEPDFDGSDEDEGAGAGAAAAG